MARLLTAEQEKYLRRIAPGKSTDRIAELVSRKYGMEITRAQIRSFMKNHHIRNGLVYGERKQMQPKFWTPELVEYVRQIAPGLRSEEIAEKLNAKFGTDIKVSQIQSLKKNHHITSGIDTKWKHGYSNAKAFFKKGEHHCPEHEFPAGHIPANKTEIGTLRKRAGGVWWIKTGEGALDWKEMHKYVWEQANGKVPSGSYIIYLDGNKDHYQLENLAVITAGEKLCMIRKDLFKDDAELTRAGIALARLACEVYNSKRKRKEVK